VDEFGRCEPDAIPKKLREEWATIDRGFATAVLDTHEKVTRLRTLKDFPRECIGPLHRELNRQTAAFNQRVEPLRISSKQACVASSEAARRLMATRPTTLASLAAVAAYFRNGGVNQLVESILYDGDHMNDFLDMITDFCGGARRHDLHRHIWGACEHSTHHS
jgi:hypothetical protein